MLKPILEQLTRRENLSLADAAFVASHICGGEGLQQQQQPAASDVQITALLCLLRAKGETGDELLAFAQALRTRAIKPQLSLKLSAEVVDFVGTGGDGHDTVNLSTAAAIVAASCGAKVAKHGNRSASSKSGSADVLQALGIPMLEAPQINDCLERAGIAFLFAPLYHPTMARLAPIRKDLGIRTIFNVLGPLINPCAPLRMVLGVYTPDLLNTYADAVIGLDVEHVLVVHCCGLDEMAAVGVTKMVEVTRKEKRLGEIEPESSFGIKRCTIEDLKGGDAEFNAAIIRNILSGRAEPHQRGMVDTIALNAGSTLYVSGISASIEDGYKRALAEMQQGNAIRKLEEWVRVSNELHANKRVKS